MEGYIFRPNHHLRLLTMSGVEINLSELQKSLDSTALELVENQKENMVGRKKLAEQTRGAFTYCNLCDRY